MWKTCISICVVCVGGGFVVSRGHTPTVLAGAALKSVSTSSGTIGTSFTSSHTVFPRALCVWVSERKISICIGVVRAGSHVNCLCGCVARTGWRAE